MPHSVALEPREAHAAGAAPAHRGPASPWAWQPTGPAAGPGPPGHGGSDSAGDRPGL